MEAQGFDFFATQASTANGGGGANQKGGVHTTPVFFKDVVMGSKPPPPLVTSLIQCTEISSEIRIVAILSNCNYASIF